MESKKGKVKVAAHVFSVPLKLDLINGKIVVRVAQFACNIQIAVNLLNLVGNDEIK